MDHSDEMTPEERAYRALQRAAFHRLRAEERGERP